MPLYTGVSGANREVKTLYTGVGGANKVVKEMYAGVSGVNRKLFSREVNIFQNASNPYQLTQRDPFNDLEGTVTFGQNIVIFSEISNPTYVTTNLSLDVTGYSKICVLYDCTASDVYGYELFDAQLTLMSGGGRTAGLTIYGGGDGWIEKVGRGSNLIAEIPINGRTGQKFFEIQARCAYVEDPTYGLRTYFDTTFTIKRIWME